jgi:hypothetical protein
MDIFLKVHIHDNKIIMDVDDFISLLKVCTTCQTKPVDYKDQNLDKTKVTEYILSAEHLKAIGNNLDYDGEVIGKIISRTEILVNDDRVDIGKYIHDHNIDTNKIRCGVYRFKTLYKKLVRI